MSKKKSTAAPSLDLGIGELLSRQDSAPQSSGNKQDVLGSATTIVTLDEEVRGFSDEYANLAHARQWGILASRAETAIASDEDFEARLWWIRAHLGALSLPVSLLAAPFETLCRQLCSHPKEAEIFRPLVVEIGQLMRERLRSVEDRRQEQAVALALHQLGVVEPDEDARGRWTKTPPRVPRFELGTKPEQSAPVVVQEGGQGRKPRVVVLLAALIILLAGLVTGVVVKRSRVAAELVIASEALVASDSNPNLMPPLVEARGMQSNLGAIYYSISDSQDSNPGVSNRPAAPEPHGAMNQTSLGRGGEAVPASEKPVPPQKEVVNTDGPVEGPEFRRGVERRSTLEAQLPNTAPDAPPERNPEISMPEIGGAVLGEVKSVIVSTNVLDSPSYRAKVIGRLKQGDKVSVEARNGQWLRIRSLKGRTGYVFAQDIGEIEEFSLPEGRAR